MGAVTNITPVVSKIYCFSSQTTLMVRRRPQIVNGGGLVVMNSNQKVVFSVDGCGILGVKGELILRDGDGAPVLFIRKKGGVVQALSAHNRWNSYLMDYERPSKLVFSLREPKSRLLTKSAIKISIDAKENGKDGNFEVKGSFSERACTIMDRRGNVVAQVGLKETMANKDFYHVVVQPGYDQAFVIGVIAILDNIHGESTRC
ncbi:protein LURP-one-related 6-like [Phoenix dactylifera]|uniref:Protein LURP-one-related 6-like n=1 Tax=Phoenix dactylifera TaxID=42345 RepID=A0A8B7BPG8_PHODC|nr:protein LURP-one-related 6-like [Phoenix dactylifera]